MTANTSAHQCVILVGGRGTRLGALTDATPKPLLPIAGRPFLEYLVRDLAHHGFTDVILLAGYHGQQMQDFANTHTSPAVHIRCLIEPEPAGTGGALKYAHDVLAEEFLLLNGDSWLELDYADLARGSTDKNQRGRIALRRVADARRYGTVELDGERISRFIARSDNAAPGLMNCGIYWLKRSVLDFVDALPCSLEHDVLPRLAAAGHLAGKTYDGYFIDIGVPEDLQRAQHELPHRINRAA